MSNPYNSVVNLDSGISAPTAQVSRTFCDCRVTMLFQPDNRPDIRHDVAALLLSSINNEVSINETGPVSVQSIYTEAG